MKVKHVFYTLQGEGPQAGRRAVFIRLADCPLQCFYCDTDFAGGDLISVDSLVSLATGFSLDPKNDLCVITGGEPLAQPDIFDLCDALYGQFYHVQVETSGVVDATLPTTVGVVCSPKTPRVLYRGGIDAWKYVLRSNEIDFDDGLPNHSTQIQGKPQRIARPWDTVPESYWRGRVWVQPCDEGDVVRNRANLSACAAVAMRHGYRVGIQLHKLIGLE